jgi:ABC-type phosphate transport system substrate-binding protein
MRSIRNILALLTVGALGLALAPFPAGAQEFYAGGSTALFNTQVLAALASMSSVSKVYRLCGTGNSMGTTNACAGTAGLPVGAPISSLQNFMVIEGTMRNCGSSCNSTNLGTPTGGSGRYYISANGSDQGVLCSSAPKQKTGFLGIAGNDGVLCTTDDPGVSANGCTPGTSCGICGTGNGAGIPVTWPGQSGGPSGAGPTFDLSSLTQAALVSCTGATGVATFISQLPASQQPTTTSLTEWCVVDIDANDDGQIGLGTPDPLLVGRPVGSFSTIGTAETSNLALNCTLGASDVGPQDFNDASLNSLSMDHQKTVGGQIFKIVASANVRPSGSFYGSDSQNKISLAMPQLQGLFGGANGGTDACSWTDVGGQVTGSGGTNPITVCFREDGSGTRETFRNTFMLQKNGQHTMGVTAGTFGCDQEDEGGTTDTLTNKVFVLSNGSGNVVNCMNATLAGSSSTTGRLGYLNASSQDTSQAAGSGKRRWGSVVLNGIDIDAYEQNTSGGTSGAAKVQNLVKCGAYPFWGTETVGNGAAVDPGSFIPAQENALSSVSIFNDTNSPDYLPAGNPVAANGIANTKTRVSAQYFVQWQSANCDSNLPLAPLGPGD